MLTKREREVAQRAKRILEEAFKRPPEEDFEEMIRDGLIDDKGRLIRNGSAQKKRVRRK